jgi:tetratricopeptide (TPR) repeat protein
LILGVLISVLAFTDHRDAIHRTRELERELVSKMERTGTWLREYAVQKYGDSSDRELVIAATTIGALKWASNATVIDMLGLTDRTIATRPRIIPEVSNDPDVTWKERKYNADYVLERAPEFIVFSTGLKPSAFAERALHAREFYVQYYPYYYDLPESKDMQIMFRRKPEQVLRRSPQQVVGLSTAQITALRAYPAVIMEASYGATQDTTAVQRLIADGPPNFSMPYILLGDIHLAQQRYDSAAANYTRAITIDPCMIRGHYQLLQFAMARNDTAATSLHLDWVRRCNPRLLTTLGMQVPPNVY